MVETMSKPVLAIYTQRYLNNSMTFVYRQILSATRDFDPVVLTSNKVNNLKMFPFEKLYSKKITPVGRFYRIFKKSIGHFATLSPKQEKYFFEIINSHGVKLVHAHFGPSAIEILPVVKKLNIPLLVTFHGYDASSLLNKKRYLRDLNGVLEYASIITVSDYMSDKLKSLKPKQKNLYRLYYGIDLEKFPFVERKPLIRKFNDGEEIICLQISNFTEKKGHQYTVRAFSELLKKYSRCKLILGGTGELLGQIKSLTSKLGIEDKVQFVGKVNPGDVFMYMKKSDLFFHHSITASDGDQEGIPNVIMEAMATGLPVISTYHAGIPELIQDGVDGFLVKEKDISGYAASMIRALSSDQNISYNALKKVKKEFNLELQSKKLFEIYTKILNN